MIYDSLDAPCQNAYNRSVFIFLRSMDQKLYASVYKQENANNLPSVKPSDMKISDSLHLGKANLITKFHLSRINREGNVLKFAHVKIDEIFSKFEFLQKIKSHYLDNH